MVEERVISYQWYVRNHLLLDSLCAPSLMDGGAGTNDLYLGWIDLCPRNGVFSLVPENCVDACAVEFSAILNFRRHYICTLH